MKRTLSNANGQCLAKDDDCNNLQRFQMNRIHFERTPWKPPVEYAADAAFDCVAMLERFPECNTTRLRAKEKFEITASAGMTLIESEALGHAPTRGLTLTLSENQCFLHFVCNLNILIEFQNWLVILTRLINIIHCL